MLDLTFHLPDWEEHSKEPVDADPNHTVDRGRSEEDISSAPDLAQGGTPDPLLEVQDIRSHHQH